jgi:drug/metabolite transporter (DMT)-like permease
MIKLFLLLVTGILATTGISFLRRVTFPALSNISFDDIIAFLLQPALWIGIFFSGVTFLLYLWILAKYETSSIVPALFGINLVVLSIFSVLFFNESLTFVKVGGYAMIFGGMWLLL